MRILFAISILMTGLLFGWFGHLWHDNTESSPTSVEKKPLYWVAPMDPDFRRDGPGKSPMGMDLVPVYQEREDDSVVRISPAVENNLGVKTVPVVVAPLSRELHTVGYVDFDEEKLAHVHVRAEGWVDKLDVISVGDPIRKGQMLFEFYSPQLVFAQEEYIAALAGNNTSLQKGAEFKLRALGISEQQILALKNTRKVKQNIVYTADRDGYLSALNVREGAYLDPQKEVMAIGQLDSVWVIAEVFQQEAQHLSENLQVRMTVDGYPGRAWEGVVEYIYPIVDKALRTVRVRIRFANDDGLLKPNMFANLAIAINNTDPVIQVPRQAVIRTGKENRVIKSLGDGRFRAVTVVAGEESNNAVEVVEGLSEGDIVVVSAQFLLDSESSKSAELTRIDAEKKLSTNNQSAAPASASATTDTAVMQQEDMDHSQMNHTEMDHSVHEMGGAGSMEHQHD